jgi:hypothetical protein
LIRPDGYPDPRIDAFFSSRRMTSRAEATNTKYAFADPGVVELLARSGCGVGPDPAGGRGGVQVLAAHR